MSAITVKIFLNLQRISRSESILLRDRKRRDPADGRRLYRLLPVCDRALEERSKEKAMKVIEKESQADELEIALRTAHMKRLARNECSTESGIVFLDALVCLERISDHARNIAEEILTAE